MQTFTTLFMSLTAVQLTIVITLALTGGMAAFIVTDLRQQRRARAVAADARLDARIADDERARHAVRDEMVGSSLYAELYRMAGYGTLSGEHVQVIPLIRPAVEPVAAEVVTDVEPDEDDEATGEVPVDARTADVLAAPDLSARDVVGVVEAVAPGVGSVVSIAEVHFDTFECRTPTEQRHLDAAYEHAYEEHEAWKFAEMFRAYDDAMHAARSDFAVGTRVVSRWLYLHHEAVDDGTGGSPYPPPCAHCDEAMHEISTEHKQIVGSYVTGEYVLVGA